MFRHLAHLGLVVVGIGVLACWGCSQGGPKGDAAGKQGAKEQQQPAGKEAKPGEKEPESPPAKVEEKKPDRPAPADVKPPEEKPDETPSEGEEATEGRAGRAVGKVFKRLLKEPPGFKEAPPAFEMKDLPARETEEDVPVEKAPSTG